MNQAIAVKVMPHDGQYLTDIDWHTANVSAICYDLEMVAFYSQDVKPSWETIADKIHPWPNSVILDLRNLSFKKDKLTLQSPLNGQKHRIDWGPWLMEAICQLDYYWLMPDRSLLADSVVDWISQLPQHKLVQLSSIINPSKAWQLFEERQAFCLETLDQQHTWLLTEQLCPKSTAGLLLDEHGIYQITDDQWVSSTKPLANRCDCEACGLGLQRCYFHHLHSYVPLLANRYLTMHNLCQLKFYI
ncbi:hypothetical protein [Legionella sp. W05-934-2]|uniref:hypothetical protein n=1 Tax=Legionella sp. W05-934-2 TaxID=1198649 RepID=UPI003462D6D6